MRIAVAIHDLPVWSIPPAEVARIADALPGHTVVDARESADRPEAFREADILFATKVKPHEIDHADRVRWVQSSAVGVGGLLVPSVVARDIRVTNARGIHSEAIAEHALALALALRRSLPLAVRRQDAHVWAQTEISERRVPTCSNTHLLILGLGSIGTHLARMGAGLGMRVTGIRRNLDASPVPGVSEVLPIDRLRDALGRADIVALALPRTSATRAVIGEPELAAMKSSAVLVNVARGALIDDGALLRALETGRIAGAGLDAFVHEPLPADSPLWNAPNLLISPHTAAFAGDYWRPVVDFFLENFARFTSGRPLLNLVDKSLGY